VDYEPEEGKHPLIKKLLKEKEKVQDSSDDYI